MWWVLHMACVPLMCMEFAASLSFELDQCYMQQILRNIIDDLMRAQEA